MQKRIRFTLSVLDGADVLQGDLDAAVGSAEELDEIGVLAVLGREGELDARVGANLVALGDPLGHGLFFPFEIPTNPMMAKTMPRMAKRKERLLIIGRIDVTSATIPNTREATAIAERGCVSIDDSLLLNALFLTDKEEGYPFS